MSSTDQWVKLIVVLLILVNVSVMIIGYFTNKFPSLAAIVNIAEGASVILYWIIPQLQIEQHIFESREILVLLLEVMVIVLAMVYILAARKSPGLKTMQILFFGIHLTVLVLGLIFIVTFKMNRLM